MMQVVVPFKCGEVVVVYTSVLLGFKFDLLGPSNLKFETVIDLE
jgi:hypothetical protein